MATNSTRNKFIRRKKLGDKKWSYYDEQPIRVKTFLQQFPANVWPGSTDQLSDSAMRDLENRHLASLLDVWGPDHPAVIHARQRIAVKGKKITSVLQSDDLADLF